jgi:hypothetical protein
MIYEGVLEDQNRCSAADLLPKTNWVRVSIYHNLGNQGTRSQHVQIQISGQSGLILLIDDSGAPAHVDRLHGRFPYVHGSAYIDFHPCVRPCARPYC